MNFIEGIRKGMKLFGMNLSVLVNSILLFVVYLIGVGITSIVAKLSGKKFLEMNLGKKPYWSDLDLKKEKKEKYYRQF